MRKLLIAAALAAIGLSQAAGAADLTGTLAKIDKAGTISIGYRDSSVPFSYLDANQKPIGYSIDLCMKVVDAIDAKLGKKVNINWVSVNPKTRIPLLANGTVDLVCGSATNTLTREEQVSYLPTTFITGTKLLVKKDSGITSMADMNGKAIALAQGTTNEKAIKKYIAEHKMDVKILPVRDHAEGFLALETGRVDAYSTDHILLFGLKAKSKDPAAYDVVGDFLSFDPYGIMIPRNDSDFALVGRRALADLFRSGEINKIYDKWFKPLGVEETPLLKAAFQIEALPE